MDALLIWEFLQQNYTRGNNSPVSDDERITEDGQTRLTEDGEIRIIE